MPIPTYEQLMLPLMKFASDAFPNEALLRDAVAYLVQHFSLSPEESAHSLRSGQSVIYNRTGWAKTELVKAGLLEQQNRGSFRITERGRELLATAPSDLTRSRLMELYPEFREWIVASSQTGAATSNQSQPEALNDSSDDTTPDEQIDRAAKILTKALESELLERVRTVTPEQFEQIVVDLLIAMGFGGGDPEMGERIGRSGDGGIDGVIREDALGLDAIYVQAKRYKDGNGVGAPALQAFVGSLVGNRATKGVFVTSSHFTEQAQEYARTIQHRIVLIDGPEMASLLVRHGVGVREDRTVTIRKLDEGYFAE